MELVGKIFDTLEINQLALVQLGLVVVLAFLLSILLIRPILKTFDERENLSVKPLEESRRLLADADEKSRRYDESIRKSSVDALLRKRNAMEETSRAERKRVEAAVEDSNRRIEGIKGQIFAEKETVAAALRSEVAVLSREIAEKVLGRRIA
jgi:F-type H+-transporting ATPase subunit b